MRCASAHGQEGAAPLCPLPDAPAPSHGTWLEHRGVRLRADRIDVRAGTEALLEGNIAISTAGITIEADEGRFSWDLQRGALSDVSYQGIERRASIGFLQWQPGDVRLEDIAYTSCPPQREYWRLRASQVRLDDERGLGVAWHARLEAFGIPILYWPVLQFPMGHRRLSGLLSPSYVNTPNSGNRISWPVYLNLAPHYDVTITPSRLDRRGNMLEVEARYLERTGQWRLNGASLPEDQLVGGARWLWQLRHQRAWSGWKMDVDYVQLSDEQWFADVGNAFATAQSPDYIQRSLRVGKEGEGQSVSLLMQGYKSLTGVQAYSRLPQLAWSQTGSDEAFALGWPVSLEYLGYRREATVVDGETTLPESDGERFGASVGANWPMLWERGYLRSTLALRHLRYRLGDALAETGREPAVTAPSLTVDGGLFFDRQVDGSRWMQSIEPKLYYRYTPYRNQSPDLPRIDSGQRPVRYATLFAPERLSGGDRLADINRLSVGAEGRIVDLERDRETLRWQLGWAWHFADRRVALDGATDTRRRTPLLATLDYTPAPHWRWRATWSAGSSAAGQRSGGSVSAQYRRDEALFNLRWRRDEAAALPSYVDSSGAWRLGPRWRAVFRVYQDVDNGRQVDRIYGLEYRSCCWRFAVVHRRYLDDDARQEDALLMQFHMTGLGGLGDNWERPLVETIPGYELR